MLHCSIIGIFFLPTIFRSSDSQTPNCFSFLVHFSINYGMFLRKIAPTKLTSFCIRNCKFFAPLSPKFLWLDEKFLLLFSTRILILLQCFRLLVSTSVCASCSGFVFIFHNKAYFFLFLLFWKSRSSINKEEAEPKTKSSSSRIFFFQLLLTAIGVFGSAFVFFETHACSLSKTCKAQKCCMCLWMRKWDKEDSNGNDSK